MTRSPADVAAVLELHSTGHSALSIARLTGVPRSTVRDWVKGRVPNGRSNGAFACGDCGQPAHDLTGITDPYLYLLGLYLGDGCISAHPRGVYRLRIFLDLRYPGIVDSCAEAMRAVVPTSKVGRQLRRSNYVDRTAFSNVQVSAYSKCWPCLIPQHGPGRKHERKIRLEDWQGELLLERPQPLLRGLIHSDGCRFMNTGRKWRAPRYSFSNLSEDIRGIFCEACDALGIRWTTAPRTVYVSRVEDVAKLDEFIGPKA
jgi:hypothetical protein